MSTRLRLLPTADVALLGERHYLFDRAAQHENVVYIPTQRISSRLFALIERLKRQWPAHEPQTWEDMLACCESGERTLLEQLRRAGYIEEVAPPPGTARSADDDAVGAEMVHEVAYFRDRVLKHYFRRDAFFHLPEQIDDDACEVAMIGVPVSSTRISSGTVAAPARLRRDSQRAGFWFDFHANGVYTETGCDGDAPRLLGVGTTLKDFGDVGADARTVGELFARIAELIETRLLPNGIRPVFIGGDHAISFPIVDCYLRHYPDLVLLHLDAHNDLFYTERVEFNHAGPIHGLLAHSDLRKVISLGLRTVGDPRVEPYQRMARAGLVAERVRLHSLGALKRWLQQPDALRAHLAELIGAGTPCYLSIDLDVLSPECLAGQLSTPAGHGLEWHELLELVRLLVTSFDVLACDVVEFNPDHKDRAVVDERELVVLLLELIDGLGRARRAQSAMGATQAAAAPPPATPVPAARAHTSPAAGSGDFARPLAIDRRAWGELDYRSFLLEYALPGRPLILTGLDAAWPALSRWSIAHFLALLERDEMVDVARHPRAGDSAGVTTRAQSARATLEGMQARAARGLRDDDARDYIVSWQFADSCAALLGDYAVPEWFLPSLNAHVLPASTNLCWLFVGEPGSGTPTHTDILNSSAWLMLVMGRKRWRMVPAADLDACGRVGAWADLFAPDHRRYPALAQATLYEAEQLPGELLWTPPLCVHAVQNLDFSIAVTQNYVDLTNLVEVHDALVGGPRALKPQDIPAALLHDALRDGLDDFARRGLLDAAEPVLAHLRAALIMRQRLGQRHAHGLAAALRALERHR